MAESFWHPVSEPPTESDGDDFGNVMVYHSDGVVLTKDWVFLAECKPPDVWLRWARTRDVVIFPLDE